jgi:tetratricopeptide (TPR) repeat protein
MTVNLFVTATRWLLCIVIGMSVLVTVSAQTPAPNTLRPDENTSLEAKLYELVYEGDDDVFPAEAVTLINSWVKREPQNATALAYLAQLQRCHLENAKLAEETARKALAINAEEPVALFVRARRAEDIEGFKGTIPFYLKAINANPNFSRAYYYLGISYNDLGKSREASKALYDALRTAKTPRFGMYTHSAMALLRLKEYAEAERRMRISVDMEPRFEYQWSYLGEILMAAGKYAEAEQIYRDAIRRFGKESFSKELAEVLSKQGAKKEAK